MFQKEEKTGVGWIRFLRILWLAVLLAAVWCSGSFAPHFCLAAGLDTDAGPGGRPHNIYTEAGLAQETERILEGMALEEKVYQLFIITPEALTGSPFVTTADEGTRKSLEQYPVGGLVYFSKNLVNPSQAAEMLQGVMAYSWQIEGLPLFTCIDEEGGRVARIGGNKAFGVDAVGSMRDIKSVEEAFEAGKTIGSYLARLGFNLDFAPDADVLDNGKGQVIGDRSFGDDPERVTQMAAAVSEGLHSQGVLSTFKHFPGHGAASGDTHEGFAYTDKSYGELLERELKPFMAAGERGVDAVMAAHISLPGVTGDNTPCTMSRQMLTEVLRGDLGYEGLIVTDALNMGAITKNYTSAEAAVGALEAGADLLLMPQDFHQAAEGVLGAVLEGKISQERIDQSVRRIIRAKLQWSVMGQ